MRPKRILSQPAPGFFLRRPGRSVLGLAALLAILAATACVFRESGPRSSMDDTLALVKHHTLKKVLYNDEFASKATLSATYISPHLADQLARQRQLDFKSPGHREPANISLPWSRERADYVFVAGIQGLNFKPADLNSPTVRWRLNLIMLDDDLNPLAVIPAELIEHGKNPRDLIDYFPHLTNWDDVYTVSFTLADRRWPNRANTLRLELSGPSGRIELDFPLSNY